MAALSVQGLTKRFGRLTAVDNLSFDVQPGTITGFLGPNGAGKTTTLRMLLGLVHPTAGVALVDGTPYDRLDRPAFTVGAALEATGFHPGRTARNHLRILAHPNGIPTRRVDEVLAEVDLADAARRRVGGFSLGMRQRLMLAGALLGDPADPGPGRADQRARPGRGALAAPVPPQPGRPRRHGPGVQPPAGRAGVVGGLGGDRQERPAGHPGQRAGADRAHRAGGAGPDAAGQGTASDADLARAFVAELAPPDEVVARGVTSQQVGEAVAATGCRLRDAGRTPQPRGRVPRADRHRRERDMTALVRTELLKLYWTRATWGLVAAAVLLVLVRVELLLAGVGQAEVRPPAAAS